MKPIKRPVLINVHQVVGDEDAIEFLRNADKEFVEGLFFQAKMFGVAPFEFKDRKHELVRNKNLTYSVNVIEDDDTEDIKNY
ncbi:MAG: hypothetical protein WCV86_01095 [Patescibacteria group bacterium]|jgi:hypothetical protein